MAAGESGRGRGLEEGGVGGGRGRRHFIHLAITALLHGASP